MVAGAVVEDHDAGTKTIQLRGGAGNIQKDTVWTIQDGDRNVLSTYTVVNATQENLTTIAADLADDLDSEYSATADAGQITLTHAEPVNAWVEKATSSGSVIRYVEEDNHAFVISLSGLGSNVIHLGHGDIEQLTLSLGSNIDHVKLLDTLAGPTTIDMGGGADQLDVQMIHGPTTIHSGDGTDIINVGNSNHTLFDIYANLWIHGDGGIDVINIDNGGSAANASRSEDAAAGRLTSTQLSGLNLDGVITYENVEELNLQLGSGQDLFTIDETHKGATNVNSNDGADILNIRSVAGVTDITAGEGDDIVNVYNSAKTVDELDAHLIIATEAGSDTLNIDDSGDDNDNVVKVTANRISGLEMSTAGITYGGVERLNVFTGGGNEQVTVDGSAAVKTVVATFAGTILWKSSPPAAKWNLILARGKMTFT